MADLFVTGEFQLHSGATSTWKIDCDALTISDLDTLARLAAKELPPFGAVIGVPTGGTKFADALQRYVKKGAKRTLIVDDVLTTGGSLKEARKGHKDSIGLVIFARGPLPKWVKAMFTYTL